MGGKISHEITKLMLPTPVLVLHNLCSDPLEELEDEENYQELLEDVRDECGRFGHVKLILIPKLSDYASLKREYERRKALAIVEYNEHQEYIRNAQSEFEKPKKKRKKKRQEPNARKEPIVPVDGFLRKNADCEIFIEAPRKSSYHLEANLGIGKVFVEFEDEFESADARAVGSLTLGTRRTQVQRKHCDCHVLPSLTVQRAQTRTHRMRHGEPTEDVGGESPAAGSRRRGQETRAGGGQPPEHTHRY